MMMVSDRNSWMVITHTPKCAGKSFRNALQQIYGDRMVRINNNPITFSRSHYWKTRLKHVLRPAYLRDADVLFGHTPVDYFDALARDRPVTSTILLRERACSEYLYLNEKYPSRRTTPEQFLLSGQQRTYFKLFMGRRDVRELDCIVIQERYAESLDLFQNVFGVELKEFSANRRSAASDYGAWLRDQGLLAQVRDAQTENRRIYDTALRRFDQLYRRYCANRREV
jgi:hypothetical protein